MDIRGIGQYTQSIAKGAKPQPAAGAAAHVVPHTAPAATPAGPQSLRGGVLSGGGVQARDLLTDEERGYLEMLFPGSTAADTYGGKGTSPAPPTGSIVDRKG
ncbi:MAG TPA: hypothetical protein VML00_07950 [Bacteroidota bacterium]|nr:hypothetical protein [Bacteroidota bacterium]